MIRVVAGNEIGTHPMLTSMIHSAMVTKKATTKILAFISQNFPLMTLLISLPLHAAPNRLPASLPDAADQISS